MKQHHRHPLPKILVVSSGKESDSEKSNALQQASALGASFPVIFQLREKQLDAKSLYSLCVQLKPLLKQSGSLLVVNERADIALASGADGVHLPESSCPADSIRRIMHEGLAGQSVHSLEAAVAAERAGIDYLLFGPVFATPSKERFGPPQGLDALEKVCRAVTVPVFAVGGITPGRSYACLESGAWGISALGVFADPASLPETINAFLSFFPS